MRQAALVLGVFVLFAVSASAQVQLTSPHLFASSIPEDAPVAAASTAGGDFSSDPAPPAGPEISGLAASLPEAAQPAQQVSVTGVFPRYHWQAYAGYTFLRFYVVPGKTSNMNGLNLSLQYYPWAGHFAGDGEFIGTFGAAGLLGRHGTEFAAGMGGLRGRWAIPLGMEIWGHGLVGGAHFLPQTPYGTQTALAYEIGGGVDIGRTNGRFAYRASAEMIGTHFFGTYQYSPKFSVGVIFKY